MQTHKKPFKCDICQKSFTKKVYLSKHMAIHTRENPNSSTQENGQGSSNEEFTVEELTFSVKKEIENIPEKKITIIFTN